MIIIITRKGYDESQTKIEKHSSICGTKNRKKETLYAIILFDTKLPGQLNFIS